MRVQATDPEEVEIAVSVVLTVPSDAVVSVDEMRLLPDKTSRREFETVAVQMRLPLELIALIVVVAVRVDVSITVLVTKIVPLEETIVSLSA